MQEGSLGQWLGSAPVTRFLAGNSVGLFNSNSSLPGWHHLVRADAILATPSKEQAGETREIRKKQKPGGDMGSQEPLGFPPVLGETRHMVASAK